MATYDKDGDIVDFEIGDVVALRSGGPDMTVTGVAPFLDDDAVLPYPGAKALQLICVNDRTYYQIDNIPDRAVVLVSDLDDDDEE